MALTDHAPIPARRASTCGSGGPSSSIRRRKGLPLRCTGESAARGYRRTGMEHARGRSAAAARRPQARRAEANSRWMSAFAARERTGHRPARQDHHGAAALRPADRRRRLGDHRRDSAAARRVPPLRRPPRHDGEPADRRAMRSMRVSGACSEERLRALLPRRYAGRSWRSCRGRRRDSAARANPLRVLVEIGFHGRPDGRAQPRGCARGRARRRGTPGLVLRRVRMLRRLAAGPAARSTAASTKSSADRRHRGRRRSVAGRCADDAERRRVGVLRPGRRDASAPCRFDRPVLRVLRSGCYLTHDSIGYAAAFRRIVARDDAAACRPAGSSRRSKSGPTCSRGPKPGRTILTMGKRDVSYDAGLPVPLQLVSARWDDGAAGADAAGPRGRRAQRPALPSRHAGRKPARRSATWWVSASAIPAPRSTSGVC